jgi:hypothetical protein
MLSIYIILFSKKLYNDSTKDAKLLFDNPQILLYIYISLTCLYHIRYIKNDSQFSEMLFVIENFVY